MGILTEHPPSPSGDAAHQAAQTEDLPLSRHLEGKAAVVTGSTSGLGLTAVEMMLRRGLKGAVLAGRKAEAGEAEAKRLSGNGAKVVYQQTDLESLDDFAALIRRAIDEFGTFDILVNSAGITDRGGILDSDADLWERACAINARAPFFLMQDAAKHWRAERKPGTIVNVATVTAHGGVPFLTVYAASKAALVTPTKSAAFSLMRDGIRCNALAIGWMDTPA